MRQHCRKLVKLQKAVFYDVRSCAKCRHSCSSGIRWAALQCSWLPWNSMCTMLFSNARKAQMLFSKGLGMPTKQSPWLNPWDAGSNSACKTSRNLTPTPISDGTKPNNMLRRKIRAGVTFGRYTLSYSKPFHFVEHVRAHDPLEISSRPPGGHTSSVKNQWFMQNKNFSTIFGIFAVACMSSVVTSDVLTSDLLFWEIFLMSDILSTNMMLTELS